MKKAQKMLAMLGMAVFMLLVPMQVNAEEEEPIVIEQSTQFGNAQSLELGKTYSYYTKMKQNNRNVYVALELEEDSVLKCNNMTSAPGWNISIYSEDKTLVCSGYADTLSNGTFVLPQGSYYVRLETYKILRGEYTFLLSFEAEAKADNMLLNTSKDIADAQEIKTDVWYNSLCHVSDSYYAKVLLQKGLVYRVYEEQLNKKDVGFTVYDGQQKKMSYYTGIDEYREMNYLYFEATSNKYTYINMHGKNAEFNFIVELHNGLYGKDKWCVNGVPYDCIISKEGYAFIWDDNGDVRCYDADGKPVINEFKCDDTYTYYFQADGTAMRDRLTYHPDGEHVIYFDSEGHEVFSDFANVKKSVAGDPVDDLCFFNVYGYMYVDVVTYDKAGEKLYYANPYGVMECNGWFQFSDKVDWNFTEEGPHYGYANSDGSLMINTQTYDWLGRPCYLQGNGEAKYN